MDFLKELESLLTQIPPGRVTTFGTVAEALGDLRAAKAVYQVIREERPRGWHRVVKTDGTLPFSGAGGLLEAEGIGLSGRRVGELRGVLHGNFVSERPLETLREEQMALSRRIVLEDSFEDVATAAGFDASYDGQQAYAAAVVVDVESLQPLETGSTKMHVTFPYISTYLAHREFEPISACYRLLKTRPSLLLVDGNGILHPAKFGIACMVGLRLGKPTIGVAKSLLMGSVEEVKVGKAVPVTSNGRLLGYAFRPTHGRPVYVSPGHLISPSTALNLVKGLCRGRIPEPLRLAHAESRALRLREGG